MRSFTLLRWAFLPVAAFAFAAMTAASAQEMPLPTIAGFAYGAKDPALSRAAATRLVTAFVNSGRYKAAAEYREFFEYAADAHTSRKPTPAIPASVTRFKLMGQQFGIDYVCVAEVATVLGEERLFAHLIDVKTAAITAMAAGDTPLKRPADLTAASNQIIAILLNPAQPARPEQSAQPTQPAADAPTPYTGRPAEETTEAQTTNRGKARGLIRARKTQNELSLGYRCDPKLYVIQIGFAQARRITQETAALVWEANLWGGGYYDDNKYGKDRYYGANVPLLCRFDIDMLSLEIGVQADAYGNNYNDNLALNPGAVIGAGVSPTAMLRFGYRLSYGTKYYSHTIGVWVML